MIGYVFCGSFCTLKRSLEILKKLVNDGWNIQPFVSENVKNYDTRFFKAEDFINEVEKITGKKVIADIVSAEPYGPRQPLDALIVAPITGNTLAKVANGITDTCASMIIKAHLRQDRPLILALASNDAMSHNLKNIASMLLRKSVYFVPMRQDDPLLKPHSLVADFDLLPTALNKALEAKQLRPLFK